MHEIDMRLMAYMQSAESGVAVMQPSTIDKALADTRVALDKQFNQAQAHNKGFFLRMSSVGRPICQLWYQKNRPDIKMDKPYNFKLNMVMGDVVETCIKAILTESGVLWEDGHKVELKIGKHTIPGEHDLVIDGKVWDVKSCSPWAYKNKWSSYDALASGDSFGYIGQLAGYAKALDMEPGGWLVYNKANGEYKTVEATEMDFQGELDTIEWKADFLEEDQEFFRVFDPVDETFRKKPTGNKYLCSECGFCDYRYDCWPTLTELPQLCSSAKEPKIMNYIEITSDD